LGRSQNQASDPSLSIGERPMRSLAASLVLHRLDKLTTRWVTSSRWNVSPSTTPYR